ncbi:hypothetical protein LQW54_010853 [Pestalotiopsis sp. IQ-011]
MLRTARPLWSTSARGFAFKGPATLVSRTRTAQVGSATQPRLDSPSTTRKPLSLIHKTYYVTKPANPEEEKKWGEAKLKPHPESVSTESSVRHLMEPDQASGSAKPVSEGISHDLFAMTSQFAAFVALYFADSRATVRGWAPYWYGTYRFVLTAIVGVAIMLSLIGRAKIGDTAPRLSGLGEKFHQTHGEEAYSSKWAAAESEEKQRRKKQEKEEEKRKKEEEAKKKKEEEAQKAKDSATGKKKDEKKPAKEQNSDKQASEDEGKSSETEGKSEDESKEESQSKDEENDSKSKQDDSEREDDSKGKDDSKSNEKGDEKSK